MSTSEVGPSNITERTITIGSQRTQQSVVHDGHHFQNKTKEGSEPSSSSSGVDSTNNASSTGENRVIQKTKVNKMIKMVGGIGLKAISLISFALKVPVIGRPAIYRATFSSLAGKSKAVNSSKDIEISNAKKNEAASHPTDGKSITKEEFNTFKSFSGQLVAPSDCLNSWSKNLIKTKNPELYNRVKNTPTNKFEDNDQKAVDKIHLEGIQEHLELSAKVFNANKEPGKNVEEQEAHVAETLAKSLAYLEVPEGTTLNVPTWNENGKTWEMKEHTVESKKIGDNLPIFVLKPTQKGENDKTLVVVRGTELRLSREGAAESAMNDVDPKGIAHSLMQHEMGKEGTLRQVLDDAGARNCTLIGHSLGGAIVNLAAIHDIDQNGEQTKINKVFGFSAPGVGDDDAEKAKNNKPAINEKVKNYQTAGDAVPHMGHPIGTNYEVSLRGAKGFINEAKTNALDAHFKMNLNVAANVTSIGKADENFGKLQRYIANFMVKQTGAPLLSAAKKEGSLPSYMIKA